MNYRYLFKSHWLVITWWHKDYLFSWTIIWKSGILSLGRLFIEWDWKGKLI